MNTFYAQHSATARLFAVFAMFALLLSAFSAPFSVAFAEEPLEIPEPVQPTEEVQETPEVVEESVDGAPIEESVEEPAVFDDTTVEEDKTEVELFTFAASVYDSPYVPSCQNLFENGSFESPEVTDSSLWQKFASVTGWVIERVSDLSPTTLELHRGWSGNVAADGAQYAELDGDHSTQISQTVATVPGAEYELTWAFAPRHDIAADQNMLEVLVNGGLVGSNGPESGVAPLSSYNWTYTTVNFVATTTDTTFTFRDAGISNSFGTFVDDTQLCLVNLPEPLTVTVTACKYNSFEQPVSGWGMTITNNKLDNKLITYALETEENGCVSQDVNPFDGPFYVVEEERTGWSQADVWTDGGFVEEGQGGQVCSFFKLTDQEPEVSAQISEAFIPTFACYFMNEQDLTPAPVCEGGVNLIQNGSFETPGLPVDGFGWDIYDSVVNGLAWVVNWLNPSEASPVPAKLELQGGYYSASHGTQYAELDSNWNVAPGGPYNGEDTRVSIYQDIATIPGSTYTVSYDFSALPRRAADTNVLQVLLDDSEVAEHSADGIGQTNTVWSTYSYTFVATSTTSRIGFADAGVADSFGTLLDNVSVECSPTIPEEEIEPTPTTSGGGGSGGRLGRSSGTPTVAGDSISTPSPEPMVLGEQVTAVPYGAPGTGHGGTSTQTSGLTLLQVLFTSRKIELVK